MSRRVTVGYYAVLREQRGLAEERLDTGAATPQELYETLRAAHGFHLGPELLRVAINEEYAAWDTPLEDGDVVVFVPPVAGG